MYATPIYIIDGARTPFLKSKNRPGPFAASDLATQAGRALLMRQPFRPDQLDEVILGCAAPSVDEVNIGRVAALRMGTGQKVPGWTVMRNCASGMQAIDSGISNILAGLSQRTLAERRLAALNQQLITQDEYDHLMYTDRLRRDVIKVDDFEHELGREHKGEEQWQAESRKKAAVASL